MVAWVLIGTNLKAKSRTDRPVSVASGGLGLGQGPLGTMPLGGSS